MVFRTFLGCNNLHLSRFHLVLGIRFTCSLEVYQSQSVTDLLLPSSVSALQLLHSGCSQEEHKFPSTQRVPLHAGSICHLRQVSSFPSCTPFQQNSTWNKIDRAARKEIKEWHNPSLCPSLTLSPLSNLFEFPATASNIYFFALLELRF